MIVDAEVEVEELKKRVSALSTELNRWRALALWSLDCHAATGEEANGLKSLSKSRRARFRSICEGGLLAVKGLEAGESPHLITGTYYHNHPVSNRLRSAIGE